MILFYFFQDETQSLQKLKANQVVCMYRLIQEQQQARVFFGEQSQLYSSACEVVVGESYRFILLSMGAGVEVGG